MNSPLEEARAEVMEHVRIELMEVLLRVLLVKAARGEMPEGGYIHLWLLDGWRMEVNLVNNIALASLLGAGIR